MSAEAVEEFAGRWIAHDGARVIAAADSPGELIETLSRTGERGAIWRVPANREEAEALVLA